MGREREITRDCHASTPERDRERELGGGGGGGGGGRVKDQKVHVQVCVRATCVRDSGRCARV